MKQMILSIYVVGLNRRYDFSVPTGMKVRTGINLMQKILSEEYGRNFQELHEPLCLLHTQTGEKLSDDCSFSQLGIDAGTKLVLA